MTRETDSYNHAKLLRLEQAFDAARSALDLIRTVAITGGDAMTCHEIADCSLAALRGIREPQQSTANENGADAINQTQTTRGN